MYQRTPVSERQYCKKCGGHLMTNHPPLGLVDVFAATLPTLAFNPGVHVNYAETVLPMRDGLPKFKADVFFDDHVERRDRYALSCIRDLRSLLRVIQCFPRLISVSKRVTRTTRRFMQRKLRRVVGVFRDDALINSMFDFGWNQSPSS